MADRVGFSQSIQRRTAQGEDTEDVAEDLGGTPEVDVGTQADGTARGGGGSDGSQLPGVEPVGGGPDEVAGGGGADRPQNERLLEERRDMVRQPSARGGGGSDGSQLPGTDPTPVGGRSRDVAGGSGADSPASERRLEQRRDRQTARVGDGAVRGGNGTVGAGRGREIMRERVRERAADEFTLREIGGPTRFDEGTVSRFAGVSTNELGPVADQRRIEGAGDQSVSPENVRLKPASVGSGYLATLTDEGERRVASDPTASQELQARHSAAEGSEYSPTDFNVVSEGGQFVAKPTRSAQRERLREKAREKYGQDAVVTDFRETGEGVVARVRAGDATINWAGGARQLATDPGAFFGETIAGRASRRATRERRKLSRGASAFKEGASETFDVATNPTDRLDLSPDVSGGPGTGQYLDVDVVDVQPAAEPSEAEQTEQKRQATRRGGVSTVAVPVVAGAAILGGAAAVKQSYTERPAVPGATVRSELEVSRESGVPPATEIGVADPLVRSELGVGEGATSTSELETPERRVTEQSELGTPQQPAQDAPEIPVGGGQERVQDRTLETAAQETPAIRDQARREERSPWDRRRQEAEKRQERREILRGPGEEVTIGREEPLWRKHEGWEPFWSPEGAEGDVGGVREGSELGAEVDFGQGFGADTATRAGPREAPAPAADVDVGVAQESATALAHGQAQATEQAMDVGTDVAVDAAHEYPAETEVVEMQGATGRKRPLKQNAFPPGRGGGDGGDGGGSSRTRDEQLQPGWLSETITHLAGEEPSAPSQSELGSESLGYRGAQDLPTEEVLSGDRDVAEVRSIFDPAVESEGSGRSERDRQQQSDGLLDFGSGQGEEEGDDWLSFDLSL